MGVKNILKMRIHIVIKIRFFKCQTCFTYMAPAAALMHILFSGKLHRIALGGCLFLSIYLVLKENQGDATIFLFLKEEPFWSTLNNEAISKV